MSTFQPARGFHNPVLPFLHFSYSRSPPGGNHPEGPLSDRSRTQGQCLSFHQLQAGLGVGSEDACAQTPPLVSQSLTTLSEPSSTPVHLHSRRTAITVPLTDLLGGVKEVTCTWELSPVLCPMSESPSGKREGLQDNASRKKGSLLLTRVRVPAASNAVVQGQRAPSPSCYTNL